MASKMIVLAGLLLAIVLISSQVAARELVETSNTLDKSSKEAEKTDGALVDDAKNPESKYGENLGRSGYNIPVNDAKYGGGGGGGGYCHRCCGHYGCHRCCTYPDVKPDAKPQAKPQN